MLAVQPVDIEQVRSLIPVEVSILPIFPGKTLGGIGVVHYGPGSVLEYSELAVVAALTTCAGKVGAWISHIYVDSPKSVAGGREIWGLPKELAQFAWEGDADRRRVTVFQGDRVLCTFQQTQKQWSLWRSPLILPNLRWHEANDQLVYFQANLRAEVAIASLDVTIPTSSPFATLGVDHPWLGFSSTSFEMEIPAARGIT